jgi:hypothetical protein
MHNGVISIEHVVQSHAKGQHPGFSAIHTARTNAGHCSAAHSGAQALTPERGGATSGTESAMPQRHINVVAPRARMAMAR